MDNILAHATLSSHAAKLAQMESAMMLSRSLAHDLNNLTTPVATYLLHTEGRAAPGSTEAEVHAAASQAVKVMNEYIRESMFFSRRLNLDLNQIVPGEILGGLLTVARERATRRGVTLRAEPAAATLFRADPGLFQRLALNLVNNAIDASPADGTVSISITAGPGETVLLSVQDDGPGVPMELRKRIFDPYFTTKNTGHAIRGLGLGLSICRKIVELHGGSIEVHNSPGRGARFTAVFPIAGPRSAEQPETAAQPIMHRLHPRGLAALPHPA